MNPKKQFGNQSQFGIRLKTYRNHAGLSQEACAVQCGIKKNQLARIEGGLTMPSLETLKNICNTLNVSPDVLFRDVNKELYIFAIDCMMDQLDENQVKPLLANIQRLYEEDQDNND